MRGMKLSVLFLLLGATLRPGPAAAGQETGPQQPAIQSPRDTLAKDTAAHRAEFVFKLRNELDTLGLKIDTLKEKSHTASEKTKAELKRQIVVLDEKRDKLIAKLDTLGRTTASKWDSVKRKTQKEVDGLKASIEKVRKKHNF